ncbi:MAG: histidinol-phosphate transaminase [Calditrichota bacterium]
MIKARESVRNVAAYPLISTTRKDKIRLDLNESLWGCSPAVVRALKEINDLEVIAYPDYNAFMKQLADFLGLAQEQLLIANGADDAIRAVMQTFIDPGDEVLLAYPSFGMIDLHARVVGADVKHMVYEADLAFPINKFLAAMSDKTRLVGVVRPDSPCGAVISRDELKKLLEFSPHTLVMLDETYTHFLGESCLDLLKAYPNLIILRSFSKAYGLAGLRIGVTAAAPEFILEMRKVNPPFSVNGMAVVAASAAMSDTSFLDGVIEELEVERQYVQQGFEALGLTCRGAAANFHLLQIGDKSEAVHKALLERGILVKNLNKLPNLGGCFRVAIGKREQNDALLDALADILQPQALLFDMDGVLVDESESYRLAIKKTAEHFLQQDVSFDEIDAIKQRGGFNNDWDCTVELLMKNDKFVPRDEVIAVFQQFYLGSNFDGLIANETWLPEGDLLDKLSQHYKLGVVTGRPRVEAEYVLKKHDPMNRIEVLIAMEDMGAKQKPHAFGLERIKEMLQVKRCIYLGDTVDDMTAAAKAGCKAIGVLAPQYKSNKHVEQLLFEKGAKHVLKSINQLPEVL